MVEPFKAFGAILNSTDLNLSQQERAELTEHEIELGRRIGALLTVAQDALLEVVRLSGRRTCELGGAMR